MSASEINKREKKRHRNTVLSRNNLSNTASETQAFPPGVRVRATAGASVLTDMYLYWIAHRAYGLKPKIRRILGWRSCSMAPLQE